MFIRSTTRVEKNTGKKYTSYQLVESVRTAQGPRQNVLLTLDKHMQVQPENHKLLVHRLKEIIGELDSLTKVPEFIELAALHLAERLWHKKADVISPIINTKPSIAGKIRQDENSDFRIVDVNHIRHTPSRSVGPEYVLNHAYRSLGLSHKLGEMGLTALQNRLISALVISRAIYPASEHATWHWLKKQSGLSNILNFDFEFIPLYRFYEAADVLYSRKQRLESFLVTAERNKFKLDEKVILYDLTNTFFEGACIDVPKAKRGKSKENRKDRPLLSLAVVIDGDGFPKYSEIFAGNVGEADTLKTMLIRLKRQENKTSPIIVMDSGISSKNNIEWLKEQGYRYIVMMKRKLRPAKELASDIMLINEPDRVISLSMQEDPEANERVLYCYSSEREKKENDIKNSKINRIEEELQKLKAGLFKKGGTKLYDKIQQKLGRLRQRYTRAFGAYDITVIASDDGKIATDINWSCDESKLSTSFSGTYCLRTNVKDLEAKKLWEIYMALSEAEALFRCIKSEVGLRPIYHTRADRIESHIFISLLAYHLIASIRRELKENGINLSWETIRNELMSHTAITSLLKTETGETICIQSCSEATSIQRKIYTALGLSSRPIAYRKTITKGEDVVTESA